MLEAVELVRTEVVHALVVGAGMSGIGAGATLRRTGVDDFLIIDQASDFGGTWRANTYPGVACDIPSQVYSYRFAPHREWSRVFAPGAEIHRYLLGVVDEYRLRERTRFGTELLDARWDPDALRWLVQTSTGPVAARILVLATDILEDPRLPPVPGLESFPGRIFHSSRWPEGYSGAGDRVALVGTGASSVQILPEIAARARRVTLFQRTPAWVLPKPDWTHSPPMRWLVRRVPGARAALRGAQWAGAEAFLWSLRSLPASNAIAAAGRWNIRRAIKDPATREALTPDYVLGCKRALLSNTYYPALARPNVDLAGALTEARGDVLVGAGGTEHTADTVVLGTGFHVVDAPIYDRVRGRDGLTLAERWKGSPKAYKGVTMASCPNAFILWGPTGARRRCSPRWRRRWATWPRRCARCGPSGSRSSRCARTPNAAGRSWPTATPPHRCTTSVAASRTTWTATGRT
jgi:cyclohexanone monooxygenase